MRFPVRLFSFRSQEALSDAYDYFRRSYKGQVEMRKSKTGGIFPYFLVLVKSIEADEDVIRGGLQELGSRGNWYEDSFNTTMADVKRDSDLIGTPTTPEPTTRTRPAPPTAPPMAGMPSQSLPPLYSGDHPAAKEIAEAEQVVAQTIKNEVAGSMTLTSFNSLDYLRVKEILDRAVTKAPGDPDLLYARASLHYLVFQGEEGQKDRDHCLTLVPDHFEASMKKEHFKSWDTVFGVPGWDERKTALSDLMMQHVEMDHWVQVVRDHLRGAVAVVVPESRINLTGCSKMRWELRWETTPQCKVAAHYLFLDNGQFQEFFIPYLAEADAKVNSNYWLLRRLARERYCFLVINRGRSVIRNERYMFPAKMISTLQGMEPDLVKGGPASSMAQFQSAAQWYMQHSDESTLKY